MIQASADATGFSQSLADRRSKPGCAPRPIDAAGPAVGLVGPLDGLESEPSNLLQCAPLLRSDKTTVGEDMSQPRPALENSFEDGRRPVAILNIGTLNHEADHQSERVDDDMALRPLIFLPAS